MEIAQIVGSPTRRKMCENCLKRHFSHHSFHTTSHPKMTPPPAASPPPPESSRSATRCATSAMQRSLRSSSVVRGSHSSIHSLPPRSVATYTCLGSVPASRVIFHMLRMFHNPLSAGPPQLSAGKQPRHHGAASCPGRASPSMLDAQLFVPQSLG